MSGRAQSPKINAPLETAATAIQLLLSEEDLHLAIEKALGFVGRVAGQDRAYLFEAYPDPATGRSMITQRCEWTREGVSAQLENPELIGADFENLLPRWNRVLPEGGEISGAVRTFPEEEQRVLLPQGIKSLLVVPVFEHREFRGFIGFDNCREEVEWSEKETSILKSLASAIGIAWARQRTLDTLADSEARFRTLLNSIPSVAIQGFDADGVLQYWNPASEELYGYSAEEALGKNVFDLLIPAEHADRARRHLRELAEKGEVPAVECEHVRSDGGRITVLCSLAHVARSGKPDEYFSLDVDLTEHKRMEQQLLRSQRMEAVGSLAGGIAHDLNNLLSPLLMSVGLMQSQTPDPGQRDMLDMMEQTILRATDLIRQVLAFERGMEGKRIDVNLMPILRDLKRFLHETLPRAITFRLERTTALPHIKGDPTQLHQVLMNLCLNARDAMPNGGDLFLQATKTDLDASSMPEGALGATLLPGPHVKISVKDTGEGIGPETLLRIFEPFFSTKSEGKGSGLGLATSLAILKSHGGAITVESQPGGGSDFTLYLPAVPTFEAPPPDVAPVPIRPGNGQRILVVDDEEPIRRVTREMLALYGYRVLTAKNGREAVDVFRHRHEQLHLVITDLMMPEMGGLEAMTLMRRINPQVPILATSGLSSNVCKPDQPPQQADRFLAKPYRTETLLQEVQALIGR